MAEAKHTPGPWRWELNRASQSVELCGGGVCPGTFDWRVLTFRRWGRNRAQPEFWTWEGNLGNPELAKDLAAPVKNREHHADWFADIDHPDARLIKAAPDLYEACVTAAAVFRAYEKLHRAKGTEEADNKADANATLAMQMEDALALVSATDAHPG